MGLFSCVKPYVARAGTITFMEPVTTAATAWTIAKTAGEISKKLYELGKSLKDREAKQRVDEILDEVREPTPIVHFARSVSQMA